MKKLLKKFIECVDYHIGESFEFLWCCYGSNAFGLCWESSDLKSTATIIYNSKDQTVYELNLDDNSGKFYRWIHPKYVKKHDKEAKSRNVGNVFAYDNVKYQKISPQTLLKKLKLSFDENTLRNNRRK